jgi:hypothetical protein
VGWGKGKKFCGTFCFAKYEIRKRKKKGSKSRPHSSPDPSCGREESRGGAIPFPQKNSLPRRVQISFPDFRQKKFGFRPKGTASQDFSSSWKPPRFARRKPPKNLKKCRLELYFGQKRAFRIFID